VRRGAPDRSRSRPRTDVGKPEKSLSSTSAGPASETATTTGAKWIFEDRISRRADEAADIGVATALTPIRS